MEIVADVFIAIFFAEMSSGLFHWWEERYGNPDWPIIGKWIVQPNIEHHQFPGRFCNQSYWVRNNTTMIPALVGAAVFYWCLPVFLGFLLLSQMNEIHSWAHRKCGIVIRFFQRIGIFQSLEHHKKHHCRPYDRNYCIMTNYLNPVLEKVKFWECLEWVTWMIFRVKPLPNRTVF